MTGEGPTGNAGHTVCRPSPAAEQRQGRPVTARTLVDAQAGQTLPCEAPAVWEFGVTTHDLLHAGVLVQQWINVRVAADTYLDASRTAIQIGMCHGYATECLLRI